MRWYRLAAEQEYAEAQFAIGIMFLNGQGVVKNNSEAAIYFRMAACQDLVGAQFNLALLYTNGDGVPQYYKEAEKWYRLAAEHGDKTAQCNLGNLFAGGLGVPQDYVEAHMWYNLSAAQGIQEGKNNRDYIASFMTPSQLAEAQRRARNFEIKKGRRDVCGENRANSYDIVSTGTGFFVNTNGYLLTNAHVIESCEKIQVRLDGTYILNAEVLRNNNSVDLSLLKIDPLSVGTVGKIKSWKGQVATFRQGKPPRMGDSVLVYGYPLAGALSAAGNLTTGNISALSGFGDDMRVYQISAPVQPGNSGGPLLDENGRVIGVVVSKLDAIKVAEITGDIPQNVNFAVKGDLAKSFLGLYQIPYEESEKPLNINAADVAEKAKYFTVQVECT